MWQAGQASKRSRWTNIQKRVVGYSDYNLFFGGQSEAGENWTKWQKKGFDLNSVIADPLFVNPARDDYRLNPESPAFKLGFQPIDVTKIGIRHKER